MVKPDIHPALVAHIQLQHPTSLYWRSAILAVGQYPEISEANLLGRNFPSNNKGCFLAGHRRERGEGHFINGIGGTSVGFHIEGKLPLTVKTLGEGNLKITPDNHCAFAHCW